MLRILLFQTVLSHFILKHEIFGLRARSTNFVRESADIYNPSLKWHNVRMLSIRPNFVAKQPFSTLFVVLKSSERALSSFLTVSYILRFATLWFHWHLVPHNSQYSIWHMRTQQTKPVLNVSETEVWRTAEGAKRSRNLKEHVLNFSKQQKVLKTVAWQPN